MGVKYNHTKFERQTQRWQPGTGFASGGSQFQKLQFRAKNSHFWAKKALEHRGAGILGNRISCLKTPPPRAKFKKGGGLGGGGLRGFFAARGYCPRKRPPGPPTPPPPI